MRLLRADIHGFGKFYRCSFSFQDGIHVLYGPNEAGKSTLHTFLGCMLFGLERGRGKAARNDLYSRFLPWEHDNAYGGSLTFESGEQNCLLERSFTAGRRTCFLTTPERGRFSCPNMALPEAYLEGLTEDLYYNTLSVRQLQASVQSSLGEALQQHFQDIRQTGTTAVSYDAAIAWLKAEKKRLEGRLTPGLEQEIAKKRQTAAAWEEQLSDLSFQQAKEELEEQISLCMEQPNASMEIPDTSIEIPDASMEIPDSDDADLAHSRDGRRPSTLLRLASFFCLLAAFGLLWAHLEVPALLAGAAAILLALVGRGSSFHGRGGAQDSGSSLHDRKTAQDSRSSLHRHGAARDSRSAVQRQQMAHLQEKYRELCRQEWEYEQLAGQAQALDEELNALTEQLAIENEVRLELQAVSLALSTLRQVSTELAGIIGPHINTAMSEILSGLTGGTYEQVYVDDQFRISVRTESRTVPLEALSRGTIDQVWLALRLAAIDIAFPQGGMPLLLDDCFLAYDDERLAHTLSWLAENYSGQVLIFTCAKREAALLQKERILFTLVSL